MSRGTIVLLHLLGRYPFGGIAWQTAHHLLGLRRLGWEVWYVEDSGAAPYDPRSATVVSDAAANVRFLETTLAALGFGERWAYFDYATEAWHGLDRPRVLELYRSADALINLCGGTSLREEHLRCPVRILIETDPVLPQIRLAAGDPGTLREIAAHTHYFTYGENLGSADCPVPKPPMPFHTTRPPVVPDLWPVAEATGEAFTTVATWRNNGNDVVFGERVLRWSKHEAFLSLLELPRRTSEPLELALGNVDRSTGWLLRRSGWRVADAVAKSATPEAYRDYVCGSRGEFTVAKEVVAGTRSGWFSDRSVCYLAAGRPVVTQETGFSRYVPTGEGLFSFEDVDGAAAAIEAIRADRRRHRRAAREVAAEYFDAEMLLGAVLSRSGL